MEVDFAYPQLCWVSFTLGPNEVRQDDGIRQLRLIYFRLSISSTLIDTAQKYLGDYVLRAK